MQLWMELNDVTLRKVVETMPQQMLSIIKAKGGPTKYCVCNFFFGQAVYLGFCRYPYSKGTVNLQYTTSGSENVHNVVTEL